MRESALFDTMSPYGCTAPGSSRSAYLCLKRSTLTLVEPLAAVFIDPQTFCCGWRAAGCATLIWFVAVEPLKYFLSLSHNACAALGPGVPLMFITQMFGRTAAGTRLCGACS